MTPDEEIVSLSKFSAEKMKEFPMTGPCIRIHHELEGWSLWTGTYKDDDAAKRDAARVQKKRTDSAVVTAERWENYAPSTENPKE